MIDAATRKPLRVFTVGGAGPYIIVPVVQLDQVTAVLDADKTAYWVDEEALSFDGKPEIIFVNLARGTDPNNIQQLLDSIP